jgi:hypothetical protein
MKYTNVQTILPTQTRTECLSLMYLVKKSPKSNHTNKVKFKKEIKNEWKQAKYILILAIKLLAK